MTQNHLQKGMSKSFVIGAVALVVVVLLGVYYLTQQSTEQAKEEVGGVMVDKEMEAMMGKTELTKDAMMKDVDEAMMKNMMAMSYEYSGELSDVTEGKTILGITTGGNALGTAKANYKDGAYDLLATFKNLQDPQGTDFYEGWIVRRADSFSVISTGRVEKVDGVYMNTYSSGEDLTDHDFYVLTIEPDDGDPAPADHIVEGTLTR